jgi:hypothetical protein
MPAASGLQKCNQLLFISYVTVSSALTLLELPSLASSWQKVTLGADTGPILPAPSGFAPAEARITSFQQSTPYRTLCRSRKGPASCVGRDPISWETIQHATAIRSLATVATEAF